MDSAGSSLQILMVFLWFIGANSYPTHWNIAPDSLDWYTKDNVTLINPWNYIHRLGLYKIMLKETEQCLIDIGVGKDNNPLWGLPIQHSWQFDTNRLNNFNVSTDDDCVNSHETLCISSFSWWADMNYHLAVVPFLGMVHAGYFSDLEIDLLVLLPAEQADETKFCNSVGSCLKHMEVSLTAWSETFVAMKKCKQETALLASDPQWRPDSLDKLIHLVWKGHVHSLEVASPLFDKAAALMSKPEQNFGHSWANIVEFIAATRFLTSHEETMRFQNELLPKRILNPDDVPPNIPDMSVPENEALWLMNTLHSINEKSGGRVLDVWNRAMCSKKGRENGRHILANIVANPWEALLAVAKLIFNFIFTPCDPDWNDSV